VLSLSHNKLARIEGLDSLTKLKKLDLTYNQITKLEGVENLTALEVLSLDANKIHSIDDTASLTKLSKLRTLSFQPCTPPGVAPPPEESNPCCAHPAYRVALRRLVPQITSLDGERLALVDASGGGSSDGSILGDLNVGGTNGDQSWFTTEDLAVGGSSMTAGAGRAGMVAGQPLAGLAELEAALADAKRLGARAKAMVDDAQPGVQGGASRVRAR